MAGGWWFLAAYACSGFAGLIYEVSWARLVTLYTGHTTAAASTVVAAFMGGLAGGSALGGRLAARLTPTQALWAYAAMESVVVLVALSLPSELGALTPLLKWAYADGAPGFLFSAVRLAACLVLLMIPALALGATFPLAVRWFVDRSRMAGRSGGALYAANTAGAAVGAIAAGFLLMPALGLFKTVLVGVAASVLAVLASVVLACRAGDGGAGEDRRGDRLREAQDDERRTVERAPRDESWGLAAAVLAVTGFATLTYEIAWTRVFSLTTGPSTYAFAATLAAVIIGLAIGSVVGSSLPGRTDRVVLALTLDLTATSAAAVWAGSLAGGALPRFVAENLSRASQNFSSVRWQGAALMAGLVVPTAIGLGVTFPLALHLVRGDRRRTATRLGAVYAINTVSAALGSLAAGFIVIPFLGLQDTLRLATAALILGSLIVIARGALSTSARRMAALPAVAVLGWLAFQPPWDRELLASGVYKYASLVSREVDVETSLKAGTLLYYRDGAAATVSVKRLTGTLSLSIDGKVDASTSGDMLTQKALAHLPLLLHAGAPARRLCIIGLGSGVTLASALLHPVSSVDVVEISPHVVEASRLFADDNHHALDDRRTRLILGDGRSHLLLSDRQYDVIISEPSNPWMAGVAALFTREFLLAARARLAQGGLLCQWAHTYNISDRDLRSIVATFASVFQDGTMWLMGDGDLLLIGSAGSSMPDLSDLARHWNRPGVAADLRAVSAYEPFAFLSSYVGGADEIRRYAAGAPLQSDDVMALEFSAPRAQYESASNTNAATLRGLLDPAHAPAAIRAAWAGAGAAQHRHRAGMMLAANAYETAYQGYTAALALDANDADTPDGVVRSAVAAHREPEAVKALDAAVRAHPQAIRLRIALSKLLAATGSVDGAITAAKDACRIEPIDRSALEQLASLYSDLGDAQGLETVAQALDHFFPGSRGARYYAAASRFLHADFVAAAQSAQMAIDADPLFAPAQNLLGAIRARLGQADQARAAFHTALRLDPRDPATYANLALLELSSGHAASAARLFAESLSLDPSSSSARQGLADAQRATGGR